MSMSFLWLTFPELILSSTRYFLRLQPFSPVIIIVRNSSPPPHFINVVICFVFCIHVNQDQLHHCYSFLLKYFSSFTIYSSDGVISIRDIQRAVVVQIYYYHDRSTCITGVDAAFLWTDGNDTKGESNNSDFHILSDTLCGNNHTINSQLVILYDYFVDMYVYFLFLLIWTEPLLIAIY